MEISGKILREVEFRDRLRGYDTDEVDEFLEKVAVGIDELRAELADLQDRASRVEQRPEEVRGPDDEAIRRTLVLAQRTADLAISEAREEAARLTDEARAQSEQVLTEAQEAARRLRDDAEFEAHERLDRLAETREQLEREVNALAARLSSERERLTTSLQSTLHFVAESLSLSEEMGAFSSPPREPKTSATKHNTRKRLDEVLSLPDVEVEIAEDAATAFGSQAPPAEHRNGAEDSLGEEETTPLDPDEELWARWAQGAGLGEPEAPAPRSSRRETDH